MSIMKSQSGTFYKIIVTLFILGVNHLSLSTGAQTRTRVECSEDGSSKQLPLVPSKPSENEPIASASTLNAAMASVVFLKDGAVNGTELNNSSGPTGSLNSLATEPEGGKLLSAVEPQEPKETLLTAAQSYFIEPEQSTTTTQKPTFKRRKTRRPISSLTENKKAPVIEENSYNEIPQGNPVRINPFRNNVNTSFGKSRPSNAKLGRARIRPSRHQVQTGSDSTAEAKLNEVISSTTERDSPRPSFNRRRPTQRPSSPSNEENSAPEAPTARKFPLRKPRPSSNEGNRRYNIRNNDHNNNDGWNNDNQAESTSQRPRTFRRNRPSNSSLTGSKPELPSSGTPDGGFQQQRRIRPIRPLIHSRLTNANQSPATTTSTTTTTTEAAPVSEDTPYKSPLEDILGLSEFYLNNDRPTTTPFQGLSPFPFHEMPDHLNNIINGIGPIPIAPGSNKARENDIPISPIAPLRPSLRAGTGTGARQGFVLRPRSSTSSPIDGDNEIVSRPQQRRRKRPQTTTEYPISEDAISNQRHVGGIVRSRPRGNEQGSASIRGGIPDSGVPRNPERPAVPRNQERAPAVPRNQERAPAVPRNPEKAPAVRSRIVIPNIIENEAVPIRGSRVNNSPPRSQANNDFQRAPENSMPTRGGIIIQDLRGNEEVSIRGSRVNSGLQRIPINSPPVRGSASIPNSPGNDNAPIRGSRVNNGLQRININSSPLHGGVIIPDLSGHGSVPIQGNNRHIEPQRNLLNTPAFHGGVILPNLDEDESPPPLRRIPSIVQEKPRNTLLPTNLPFPPLPLLSNSGLPQSYQIRAEPMLTSVLPIPQFKRMPETVKLPTAVVQQAVPSTPPPVRASGPASASSGLSASNVPSSPSGLGAIHIQQSLNAALSPSNFQSPGLFQVPPRDNLGFYPGLDILGINPNGKTAQRKSATNQFSSRTTIVPEEAEISFSPSASNENQAVVVSDNSYPQSANNGEAVQETNQPDLTTVTTTTITTAAPAKKLSPLERLHQTRQAAARKFLTPKKPTEKTTVPPTPVKKNSLRKSVFPPRSLRSRGKSVQPEIAESPEVSNAPKEETPGGNASDINNESISSSELDTVSNVVPISTDPVEVEQESSSRKPSILENAKRRRIPLGKSAASPVQQSQPQQQKGRSVASPTPQQHQENVDSLIPTCDGGERYNKFLKRCVATYKPRVQG